MLIRMTTRESSRSPWFNHFVIQGVCLLVRWVVLELEWSLKYVLGTYWSVNLMYIAGRKIISGNMYYGNHGFFTTGWFYDPTRV